MPLRPRVRATVRTFQVAGLGHLPDHQHGTLIKVTRLEGREIGESGLASGARELISTAQTTVTAACKSRFHVADVRSLLRRLAVPRSTASCDRDHNCTCDQCHIIV